jgi:ABC-type dipeptide/oligopeptide/nickel transport system ATPase component
MKIGTAPFTFSSRTALLLVGKQGTGKTQTMQQLMKDYKNPCVTTSKYLNTMMKADLKVFLEGKYDLICIDGASGLNWKLFMLVWMQLGMDVILTLDYKEFYESQLFEKEPEMYRKKILVCMSDLEE